MRFAARVHFLDACINAITFTDVGQTRGQTMVNGKLRHALPVASCTRLAGPAAATSLRTRSAGKGARHAHSTPKDRGQDLGSRHGGDVPSGHGAICAAWRTPLMSGTVKTPSTRGGSTQSNSKQVASNARSDKFTMLNTGADCESTVATKALPFPVIRSCAATRARQEHERA